MFVQEIIFEEPFKLKFGSVERDKCWDKITENLNALGTPAFFVDQRAVRERFIKIE